MNVALGLFEGLVQYDPETNLGVPALADSWSASPDGLVYTFKLRAAKWPDGRSVTAGDFVYAMERILDPATGADYAYMPCMVIKGAAEFYAGEGSFEDVGIRAIDDRTIEYTLTGPAPYFVDMTAHNAFWPLPRWAIEKFGDQWTEPGKIVTNGPFLLGGWARYDHVDLVRNARYWDAAKVSLKRIRIMSSDDTDADYDAYKAGGADWMHGVPLSRIDEIMLRTDFQRSAQVGTYFYCFNVTKAPVDNVLVRQALSAAIDRKILVEDVTRGGQVPTASFVPPLPGYAPQAGQDYDPEKARSLLAKAGYPDGKGFPRLTIYYNTNEGHKAVAEYVKAQWKKNLGIDVSLKNMEFKSFVDLRSKSHNFAVCRHGWLGDYLDANTMLDLFVSGGGNNDACYANPEYDALIEAARLAPAGKRAAILGKAEALLLSDAVVLPLYHYANQDLIDTARWGGWYPTPLGFHPWKYLYRR
jgi:oligopeptide transport system substrate-binding protein